MSKALSRLCCRIPSVSSSVHAATPFRSVSRSLPKGALREWLATLSALLPAEPNRQQMGRLESLDAE